MIKTILYIHQSAELYGSDKTLLNLATEVNNNPNFKVIVVLPSEGPLKKLLLEKGITVITMPIIKVSRGIFNIKNILALPFLILKQTKILHKQLQGVKIDLVHSNTIAVLLGAFYAKRYKIKHLWHVHEIIRKPKIIAKAFPFLLDKMSCKVVYNSKTTMQFWCNARHNLIKKSHVVLNGLDRETPIVSVQDKKNIRENIFHAKPDDIVFALVGRINLWKGQFLLLEAFNEVKKFHPSAKLVFIGSVYQGMEELITTLQSKIKHYNLENDCVIIPFQDNIWSFWDSIDIAVIPSTEPEPFGLVAVEAMLAKKPVIAANHGGLTEIIVDNQTGLLFTPNNSHDLVLKIKMMLEKPELMSKFSENGYQRAVSSFSKKNYIHQFLNQYNSIIV